VLCVVRFVVVVCVCACARARARCYLVFVFSTSLIQCVLLEGSPGKCWFTSACHTCTKCCHRRCWKCPPVCSIVHLTCYSCVEEHGPNYSPL
jgi:hypothetical protein